MNIDRFESHYQYANGVTVEQMGSILTSLYKNPLARRRTVCMVGESGIGKNAIIEQSVFKMGISLLWFSGKGVLAEDIRGIPIKVDTKDGTKYKFILMEYLEPAFNKSFEGIIHIDEYAQASKDVQAMFYTMFYDRRIDNYFLSDKAMIVCSMNPTSDTSYMLNKIQKAAQERMLIFKVNAEVGEWLEWAEHNNIDYRIISFVREYSEVFKTNYGRRLHMLSDAINAFDSNIDQTTLKAIAQSALDIESASKFYTYMQELNDISGSKLLSGDKNEFEKFKNRPNKAVVFAKIQASLIHALVNYKTLLKLPEEEVAANVLKISNILRQDGLEMTVALLKAILTHAQKGKNIPRVIVEALDEEIKKPEFADLLEKLSEALTVG